MKVLFLDVDGVLNSNRSKTFLALSKPALRRLKRIVDNTGCEIVLSSTWRTDERARNRLSKVLAYRGMKIYSMTPNFAGAMFSTGFRYFRGHEIKAWLDDHPEVTNYCIVDDDCDMLDSQLRNFVQTTFEHGLTDTHAYRIEYILNNGPQRIE